MDELIAHGRHSNQSFFAFTATAKDKTIELYSSLVYTSIDKHLDEKVGLYSTVLTRKEYEMIVNQD